MLGSAVYEAFIRAGHTVLATDIEANEPWLRYADVRDYASLQKLLGTFQPQTIINLAALTDLEHCETHQEDARTTNATGAEHLGALAKTFSAEYVYVSTAGVFDGEKVAYTEEDLPNPLNVYGHTKRQGEEHALQSTARHYVLRAGWMMGGGRKEKKFVGLLYRQILSGARVLHVVDDKSGTPTYTREFARAMRVLLDLEAPWGIYHLAGTGRTSRFEVAQELLRLLKREDIALRPVASEFFREKFFAPRPVCEALLDTKLGSLGVPSMKGWRECLRDYVAEGLFHDTSV